VRDDEDARRKVFAEFAEHAEDLRLHRDIERGGRLVRDEEFGVTSEGHRDHDALALAARHLVREVGEPLLRRGDADEREQFDRAGLRLRATHRGVGPHRLHHLEPDGEHGVQRRRRILEDHGDVRAAHPPKFGATEPEQLATVERDRAFDRGVVWQEPEHRHGGDTLARA
jgi:hypothetical protein